MSLLKSLVLLSSFLAFNAHASESVTFSSPSGDTLMVHQLKNGEVWGSLLITDQVSDSFADHELIILQVDKHQPIKLDQEKRCATPAGKPQKVGYSFDAEDSAGGWSFSQIEPNQTDEELIKLFGWDKGTYQHMKSDRRPEVVDFPIKANLALESLGQQFKSGEKVIFRYTTSAEESRQASFDLSLQRAKLAELIK